MAVLRVNRGIEGFRILFVAALFSLFLSIGGAAIPVQIGYAKSAGAGWSGSVLGTVTAIYPDYGEYSIESEDRSAGIIVTPLPGAFPQIGDELVVTGTIQNNGKLLASAAPQRTGRNVQLGPVGVTNKGIVGSAEYPGLNNLDMLIKTTGSVIDLPRVYADGSTRFHITDGLALPGGPTVTFETVEVDPDVVQVIIPPSEPVPVLYIADYLSVTGIASKTPVLPSGDLRAVRLRDLADISVLKSYSRVDLQEFNDSLQFPIEVRTTQEILDDNRIGGDYGCGPDDIPGTSSLGLKWIRMGFTDCALNWQDVEISPGTYYIDPAIDQLVTDIASAGFTIVMNLGCGDQAADRPDVTRFQDPQEVTKYCNYARFMVNHFRNRVRYFEIWNEPNVDAPWGQISATNYSNLVTNAAPVIRAENPDARIAIGAVGGRWDYGYPGYGSYGRYAFDLDFLNSVIDSGVVSLVDVISWHPFYGSRPDDPYYQGYTQMVAGIKSRAAGKGFSGQYLSEESLWRTEPSEEPQQPVSATVSAKYLSRSILMHLGMNVIADVSAMFPGRCGEVVPRLCSVLSGAANSSLFVALQTSASNIKKYAFSLPNGDQLIAVWTDGMGVDNDPGTPATVICLGFSAANATAIDVLNNLEQGLVFESSGSSTTIRNLLIRDYPLIIRLSPPGAPQSSGWTDDGSVVRLNTSTDRVGIGTRSPSARLHVNTIAPGNIAQQIIENSNNTNGYSDAIMQLLVAGRNSGDPYIRFDVGGERAYSMGIDNRDDIGFKLSSTTYLGGNQDILRYLPISQEFQLWQNVASYEAGAPILGLYNRKSGEVAIRFNKQMDNNDDENNNNWYPNPWLLHIPMLNPDVFKLWLTRDMMGNFFGLDEEGRVSVGYSLPNNASAIARLGVVGGRDEKQFIVRGYATQTNSLAEFQNSAGTPLVTITGDGRVGIGTWNPIGVLHTVQDGVYNGSYSGLVLANKTNPFKRVDMGYDSGAPDAGYIQAREAGAGYKPLIINPSGGNVGIGTITPVSTLHVGGDGVISVNPRSTNPPPSSGKWKIYLFDDGSTSGLKVEGPNGTANTVSNLAR